jgi:hypothetical protein
MICQDRLGTNANATLAASSTTRTKHGTKHVGVSRTSDENNDHVAEVFLDGEGGEVRKTPFGAILM